MTMDDTFTASNYSETCSIPGNADEIPSGKSDTSLSQWQFEGDIVKTELIISDSESAISGVCRLCGIENTTWFPFYNSDGSLALEAKHLDMIRQLALIQITHNSDHSSIICSFCLAKIEEFAILRDVWRRNENSKPGASASLAPSEPAVTAESKDGEDEIGQQGLHEESIVIDEDSDDSDVQLVSSSTSFVPAGNSERQTRSDSIKSNLIHQAMQIVSKQFKAKKKRKLRSRKTV